MKTFNNFQNLNLIQKIKHYFKSTKASHSEPKTDVTQINAFEQAHMATNAHLLKKSEEKITVQCFFAYTIYSKKMLAYH